MPHTFDRLKAALADRYAIERELGADRMTMHCFARPLQVMLASTLLAALFPSALSAQCADGTPPPCEVRARQVVARATPPPSEAERGRSFLVLPFRNLTRAPELEWLIDGSVALLSDALGQWQEISVVPETRLFPALRRHGLTGGEVMDEQVVRRVAAETGGWTVVTGDVLETGGRIQVRARAHDVVTNQEVARAVEEAESDEDIRAVWERVAFGLLGTEDLARRPDLIRASTTTQSLDAYRAYLRGRAHLDRMEYGAGLEAFQEAVRLDSAFALAHTMVAIAWMGKVGPFSLDPEPGEAAALLDPRSEFNRALQRAVTLSSRLPPRERHLVQAVHALFQGQLPAARLAVENMVTADSTDIDALWLLAFIESIDPVLVTVNGVERRRGSLNAAMRLLKRVTVLDPTRRDVYASLALTYHFAGGYWIGAWTSNGIRREPASFIDMVAGRVDRRFALVLRDTLELIPVYPVDSLEFISHDSLLVARARARATARAWVDRWVTAAPADPRAQLWASSVYELDGDFDAALSALLSAESLEDTRSVTLGARRMVLLGKLNRHAEAFALLDSLWGRDEAIPRFWQDIFAVFAWGTGLLLEHGDLVRADSAYGVMVERLLRRRVGDDADAVAAAALTGALPRPSRRWWAFAAAELPQTLVLTALDTLLKNIDRVPAAGPLANAIPLLLDGAAQATGAEERGHLAARAIDAAFVLAGQEREDLAFELALFAVGIDPALLDRVANAPWYSGRAREPSDNVEY